MQAKKMTLIWTAVLAGMFIGSANADPVPVLDITIITEAEVEVWAYIEDTMTGEMADDQNYDHDLQIGTMAYADTGCEA